MPIWALAAAARRSAAAMSGRRSLAAKVRERNIGQGNIEGRRLKAKLAGFKIGQRGDGVLVFCTGLVNIDKLRAHSLKLGERLGHHDICDHAALEQALVQLQLVLIVVNGRLQQAALRVKAAAARKQSWANSAWRLRSTSATSAA